MKLDLIKIVSGIAILGYVGLLFAWRGKIEDNPKTYSVKLTQQEWGSRLQTLQNAKLIMRQSSLPANVVANWSDSLDVMAGDIQRQVGAEMQKENKTDTVKPKTK